MLLISFGWQSKGEITIVVDLAPCFAVTQPHNFHGEISITGVSITWVLIRLVTSSVSVNEVGICASENQTQHCKFNVALKVSDLLNTQNTRAPCE